MPAPPKPSDSERSKRRKKNKVHSPAFQALADSSPSKASAFRDPAPIPEITRRSAARPSEPTTHPLADGLPLAQVTFREPELVELPLKQVADSYSRGDASHRKPHTLSQRGRAREETQAATERPSRDAYMASRKRHLSSSHPTLKPRRSRTPKPLSRQHSSRRHSRRKGRISRSVSSTASSSAPTAAPSRYGPRLNRTDHRAVSKLNEDLLEVIRSRPELGEFTAAQAKESALTLYRFGRNTPGAVKNSEFPKRQQFLADVREEQGFRPLSFIYDLFEV